MIDRKLFQKPKEKDFFFVRHFQRKISRIVLLISNNTFINPNYITLLSILVGLDSFYYFFIRGAVNDWIHFDNHLRTHQTLGRKTRELVYLYSRTIK